MIDQQNNVIDEDLIKVREEGYKKRGDEYLSEFIEHIREVNSIPFLDRFQEYIMTENRDSLDREKMGVEFLKMVFEPTGLPSPFINAEEENKETESSEEIRRKYQNFCRESDKTLEGVSTSEVAMMIMQAVKGYQKSKVFDNLSAGHDQGHFWRDAINACYIYEALEDQAASKTDLLAGMMSGIFHDTGTALTERYMDGKRAIAHAETGAAEFYDKFHQEMPDGLVRLIAYGIAAHKHETKNKENLASGYVVKPYFDEVWKDEMGELWGLAWSIPRLTDRLDCNGVAFMVRNINSKHDPKNEVGEDISGGIPMAMKDHYDQVLKPVVRDEETKKKEGGATFLEHAINFANSNGGATLYSKNDYMFPGYVGMMENMVEETTSVVKLEPNNYLEVDDYLKESILLRFIKLSRKVMCLKEDDTRYSDVLDHINNHWKEVIFVNDDYCRRWAADLPMMIKIYNEWLERVKKHEMKTSLQDVVDYALRFLDI